MKLHTKIIIILSLALVVASSVFYISARSFSKQASYIEVKGLSEKIVKSDVAVWSLSFQVKSNDVEDVYQQVETSITTIKSFLKEAGFEDSEINVAPVSIYQDTYQGSLFRYNTTVNMSVYTHKVDTVKATSEDTLPLLKKGILITGSYIDFQFSDINTIKPEMLKEAVVNAQQSAQDFTDYSGSDLGRVVRANQGVFSITEKDPGSPEYKKVRVVSTLRYLIQ